MAKHFYINLHTYVIRDRPSTGKLNDWLRVDKDTTFKEISDNFQGNARTSIKLMLTYLQRTDKENSNHENKSIRTT